MCRRPPANRVTPASHLDDARREERLCSCCFWLCCVAKRLFVEHTTFIVGRDSLHRIHAGTHTHIVRIEGGRPAAHHHHRRISGTNVHSIAAPPSNNAPPRRRPEERRRAAREMRRPAFMHALVTLVERIYPLLSRDEDRFLRVTFTRHLSLLHRPLSNRLIAQSVLDLMHVHAPLLRVVSVQLAIILYSPADLSKSAADTHNADDVRAARRHARSLRRHLDSDRPQFDDTNTRVIWPRHAETRANLDHNCSVLIAVLTHSCSSSD